MPSRQCIYFSGAHGEAPLQHPNISNQHRREWIYPFRNYIHKSPDMVRCGHRTLQSTSDFLNNIVGNGFIHSEFTYINRPTWYDVGIVPYNQRLIF